MLLSARDRHRHQINRVINHITENPASNTCLDELADIAFMSKFHFSRVFASFTNETPYEFAARKRIERAAFTLAFYEDKPITETALDGGFSTPEMFSRNFRRHYGIPPRAFRKQSVLQRSGRQFPELEDYSTRITVKKKEALNIAYLRLRGDYSVMAKGCIERAAINLYRWASSRGLINENVRMFGLCPDFRAFTRPSLQLYDIGVEIPNGLKEDHLVCIRTIPAGIYATLPIYRRKIDTADVWHWFAYVWPKLAGVKLAHAGCYECFVNPAVDPNQVEFLLPIVSAPRR